MKLHLNTPDSDKIISAMWKPAKKKRKAVVKHSAMERIAMWWATIKAEEAA